MSGALTQLAIGGAILAGIVWYFWAHAVVCYKLPVGRWHRRAATATAILNVVVFILVVAFVIGSVFAP